MTCPDIAEQIISFYRKRKYEAGCLTGLDHKLLSAAARRMLMQYLTEEHLYETAYRMLAVRIDFYCFN